MTNEDTSIDTLRDRLEKAGRRDTEHERSALRKRVAEDTIEYAAQLEDMLEKEMGAFKQTRRIAGETVNEARAERDEARAERDRLHDALELVLRAHDWKESDERAGEGLPAHHAERAKEALREVERGVEESSSEVSDTSPSSMDDDTVDKIRREAWRHALIDVRESLTRGIASPSELSSHGQAALSYIDGVLAETDDQEEDDG